MFFHDRSYAGSLLANKISENPLDLKNTIVLAVQNGGVPIGFEIAKKFKIPIDVLLLEKIKPTPNSHLVLGVVFENNKTLFNENLIKRIGHEVSDLSIQTLKSAKELQKKCQILRREYPLIPLENKDVILVDDGKSSFDFIDLIIKSLRVETLGKIIFATPVADKESIEKLRLISDRVEVVLIPPEFGYVGEWYEEYFEVDTEVVKDILSESTFFFDRIELEQITINAGEFKLDCNLFFPEKLKSWVVCATLKDEVKTTLFKKSFATNLAKAGYGTLMFDLVDKSLNHSNLSLQAIDALKWFVHYKCLDIELPFAFIGFDIAASAIAIGFDKIQQEVNVQSFISLDGRLDLIPKKLLSEICIPTMLIVHESKIDLVDLNKVSSQTLPNSKVSLISGQFDFFENQQSSDELVRLSIEWFEKHYFKGSHKLKQQKSSNLSEQAH